MADGQVIVVACMKAKSRMEAGLKQELLALLSPTHVEDGCIQYDMHEMLDDPGSFLFYEIWRSKEDLDRHLDSPHLVHFKSIMENLLEGELDLTMWKRHSPQ